MNRLRDSKFCWRWLLPAAFTRSQRADDLFQFPVEQRVIFLPADEVGSDAAGDFRLLAALVIRVEQEAVQVERNQREHFLATLFMSCASFWNARLISPSTHQLVSDAWNAQSGTLSQNRMPR